MKLIHVISSLEIGGAQRLLSDLLPIQNKQELVAASCAVIEEELGTDVKNIKVLSFKRI